MKTPVESGGEQWENSGLSLEIFRIQAVTEIPDRGVFTELA